MLGKKGLANRIYNTLQLFIHNLEGTNSLNKREDIEAYAAKRNVDLALFSETQHEHSSEEGGQEKVETEGEATRGKYEWYFSSGIDPEDVEKRDKLRQAGKKNKAIYEKAREYAGVAIKVSKRLWKYIDIVEPAGSRLMRIRLKMHKKLDIIVAYGQQAQKSAKEKDDFYKHLEEMVDSTPKQNSTGPETDQHWLRQAN